MSNRVEDLERQVAELQAAVNGLTEELVETKERVRQLEDANAAADERAQPAAGPVDEGDAAVADPVERTTHSDDHADVVERTADGTTGSDDGTAADDGAADAEGDDVVVADGVTTPDAEAAKEEGQREEGDDGESGDSDIIVA